MSKLHIDQYSHLESVIHHRDPRVKIIAIFAFVLCIVITPPESFMAFALYGIFIFVLILLSKIPVRYVIKRSIVIIPFVLVIAAFIPFLKKGSILWEYQFGSLKIAITYEGLIILWNVLIKAYLSILCMILLMASTRFINLIKAMEGLKLPELIVMIFSFMYRYIFILLNELAKMKQAREARSAGGKRWFHIKALSNMLGVLFIKSYERGESLYLAMCSRGFDGTIRTIDHNKLRISIATVLSMNPEILVLDEPSSNLDPRHRRELINLLKGLNITRVIATHDLEMVLDICKRVALIDKGVIVASGNVLY